MCKSVVTSYLQVLVYLKTAICLRASRSRIPANSSDHTMSDHYADADMLLDPVGFVTMR